MAKDMLPFRYNTRQRFSQFGAVTFPSTANSFLGQTVSFQVPQVGFLAGIYVVVNGSLTRGGGDTGTFSGRLFNVLKRIRVELNIGSSTLFDCSGYGTYLINNTEKLNYAPDLGGAVLPASFVNGDLHQDPNVFLAFDTPGETNAPFQLTYWIPIAGNMGRNFNMGLVNLQAPEIRCSLNINTINSLGELFTPGATVTNTDFRLGITASYFYFEVPNPDQVEFPPFAYHRTLEERMPFNNVGDVTYLFPKMGTLLRYVHNVIIDDVNSVSDARRLTVRINKTDDVYRFFINSLAFWARFNLGHSLPRGAMFLDLWNAEEVPCSGDLRDALDTEAISTLESIVEISSTASLGISNNFLDTTRELVQVAQL